MLYLCSRTYICYSVRIASGELQAIAVIYEAAASISISSSVFLHLKILLSDSYSLDPTNRT